MQEFLERQSKGIKEIPDGEALIEHTFSVPSPSSEFGKLIIYDVSKDFVDFKNKHTKIDIDFEAFWILSCELQKYRQVYENWLKKYERMDEDFKKQLDEYFIKMQQKL